MRWKRPEIIVAPGVLAAFLYSNFVLDMFFSPPHDWLTVVSVLEIPGHSAATLLRITDVICALLVFALTAAAWVLLPATKLLHAAWCLTVLFAVGGIVAAFVALPCTPNQICTDPHQQLQDSVHDLASIISASALIVAAGLAALHARRHGPRWILHLGTVVFWLGGIVGTVLFSTLGSYDSSSWQTGLAQRFQLVMMSIWILSVAVWTARATRPKWSVRVVENADAR